jgi:hypothetical protein
MGSRESVSKYTTPWRIVGDPLTLENSKIPEWEYVGALA